MLNPLKLKHNRILLPATAWGPHPGDFPLGSLKSRAAARALLKNYERIQYQAIDKAKLTPFEIAFAEEEDGKICPFKLGLARGVEERTEIYGGELMPAEELRFRRRVAKEFDRLTNGAGWAHPECKRLRAIAEEKVRSHDRAVACEESVAQGPTPKHTRNRAHRSGKD